jgi:hypothetical protein
MRCLDQSDQQSRSNRADAGNLAKQSSRRMFPALCQQFLSGRPAYTGTFPEP